jgi:hypothetical protein
LLIDIAACILLVQEGFQTNMALFGSLTLPSVMQSKRRQLMVQVQALLKQLQ